MVHEDTARLTLGALRDYSLQGGPGRLHWTGPEPDWRARLGPAANDSRAIAPGGLFVALPGEQTDGHCFIPDAIGRGATAVIATHLPGGATDEGIAYWLVPDTLRALQGLAGWWRGHFTGLPVIGITGSVGKTTAKEVLAAALSASMPVLASPRSFNNEIGLPLTLLSLTGDHRAAVLEMGIYDVGDIAFLAGMARQTIGVVLNVDAVHLERAGSIERIAQAKAEMITTLPPNGVAVLNRDDPRVWAMQAHAPGPVRSFGLRAEADWQGLDLRPLAEGLALTVVHGGARYELRSRLPGAHHAYALLAAAAVLDTFGLEPKAIIEALAAVPAPAARQRLRRCAGDRLVIDDTYNASPLSMLAALDLLAAQSARRRVAILADMLELGPIGEESHRHIGLRAAEVADLVLGVGPLAAIIAEAAGAHGRHFADRATLLEALPTLLAPGDAILVKGSRGMKMEEVAAWLCQE